MVHKIIYNAFQTQTHHREISFTRTPNIHVFDFNTAEVVLHLKGHIKSHQNNKSPLSLNK